MSAAFVRKEDPNVGTLADLEGLRRILAAWPRTLTVGQASSGPFTFYREPEYEPGDEGRIARWVDNIECPEPWRPAVFAILESMGIQANDDEPYIWWEVL